MANKRPTRSVKREQPKKDSSTKRINCDNERVSKFDRDRDFKESRMRRKGSWKNESPSVSKTDNDVSWYANSPELLKSAASIPFSSSVGLPLSEWHNSPSVPGVLAMYWSPNLDGDPLQQAKNSVYSFTVHANSRNYSYDAPDQFMMIIAGASVFTAIAHAIRAYGVMRRFSQQDAYTPQALVRAMGFDYADLQANLSNMWFDINEIISRSQQIWIPNTLPLIQRWFWMCSNLYKDGDTAKSQYYLFVPISFLQLSETGSSTGTSLTAVAWNPQQTAHTWAEYLRLLNGLITALVDSQDRGIIFGDLLNAYGADKIYAVNPISSDYTVDAVYNEEVLTQIENATSMPVGVSGITQDTNGNLVQHYNPRTAAQATALYGLRYSVLNFHQKEPPTPEQIMVATRLKVHGLRVVTQQSSAGLVELAPAVAGTEFISAVFGFKWNWSNGTKTLDSQDLGTSVATGAAFSQGVAYYHESFDWAPWIYYFSSEVDQAIDYTVVGSIGSTKPWYGIGDYDNYTLIDSVTLAKMHLTATYSLLGVPSNL